MKLSIERGGVATVAALLTGLVTWPAFTVVAGPLALVAAAVVSIVAGWLTVRALPDRLDGAFARHRVAGVVWTLLVVVTIGQTARLGAYMVDPTREWSHTTRHEFWSKHMCMLAYFYAADLNRQGEPNIYHAEHYPGLNPDAENHATVANLSPDDPYQYPPQFLLLPRLAIALSDDFYRIRPVWYSLQAVLFGLVAVALARWYGGKPGALALWMLPLLWVSVPSILNFQYGQFHVSTIALAVAAFLAFEKRRDGVGGSLLAMSILSKGFPGILVIPLLLARRWRAAAWTGAWGLAFTAVAWFVLGPEPFEAFFGYHLPRLQSGGAFAFEEAWPEFRSWLLAGNVSLFSLVRKLGDLGFAGATDGLARAVHGAFSLSLLGVAILAGRARSRESRALAWLSLVNLASFTSPAAWGDYVPVGTLWALTFLLSGGSRRRTWVVGSLTGFCALLPGIVPVGNFPSAEMAVALSCVGTLILLGTNGWILTRGVRHSHAVAERPEREFTATTEPQTAS